MKRKLTDQIINDIENEAILMLLNCLEQGETKGYVFNCNDPYYAEAFGIFRGLCALKYTYFGANNTPTEKQNAKWWFSECKNKALELRDTIGVKNAIKIYNEKCR